MKLKKSLVFLLLFILIVSVCSCGNSGATKEEVISDNYNMISDKVSGDTTNSSTSSLIYNSIGDKNVKLVYRAKLTLQTQDFDPAYKSLTELVAKYKGYFESTDVSNGSIYYDSYSSKNGSFVVRIPTESYSDFLSEIGENIHVVEKYESVENIGQSYYDVETHISSLQTEIKRLQELMAKASNMSDIITIEKALTEAENELQQYQSTLASYDSLIDYSTVTISLSEVKIYTETDDSFWTRIKNGFVEGWDNFIGGLGDFIVWLLSNIIWIAILVVLVVLCIKRRWFARIGENKRKKKAARMQAAQNTQNQDYTYKQENK